MIDRTAAMGAMRRVKQSDGSVADLLEVTVTVHLLKHFAFGSPFGQYNALSL
jgi:hypothetical protein